MIYVWKIIEGHVPNPGIVTCKQNRKGRLVKILPLCQRASARVKALREASLNIHGARLFDSLPQHVRDTAICDILIIKEKLDIFLSKIPDHPKLGTLAQACCDQTTGAPSKSLVDQIQLH